MTRTELTDVDEAEIAARYRMGATVRQLADRFGVHDSAIRRSLVRSGEERREPRSNFMARRRDDVDDDDLLQMRDEQMLTWSEIATICSMSITGVRTRYLAARARVGAPERP